MTLLETRNLDVTVAGIRVCRGLDLRIRPGECWGLLGRNGAGKTTLLHTLAGLRAPDAGAIRLGGDPMGELSRREIARRLGLLFQDTETSFPATVMEAALAGRHPHLGRWGWEGAEDRRLTEAALRAVGLDGMHRRRIETLSGGEQRRLAIATLLAQDPALALLDEPTNHLDPNHQTGMLRLLQKRMQSGGRAMLLILHDINLALRFCDHLLLLFGGGETLQGPASRVARREHLERLYGCRVAEIPGGPHGPVYLPA